MLKDFPDYIGLGFGNKAGFEYFCLCHRAEIIAYLARRKNRPRNSRAVW
jgi:hypothetical protein